MHIQIDLSGESGQHVRRRVLPAWRPAADAVPSGRGAALGSPSLPALLIQKRLFTRRM